MTDSPEKHTLWTTCGTEKTVGENVSNALETMPKRARKRSGAVCARKKKMKNSSQRNGTIVQQTRVARTAVPNLLVYGLVPCAKTICSGSFLHRG